jgi:hypothetical protein
MEDTGLTWTQKRRKTGEQLLQDPGLSRIYEETVADRPLEA